MSCQITLQEIKSTQNKVQETVTNLGGYWRPLSALARVLEEIGEIGELLAHEDFFSVDALASELADVFVITTCLANQYCASLICEYRKLNWEVINTSTKTHYDKKELLRFKLCRLTYRTGCLARVINCYEGDKPQKKSETKTTVSSEAAGIHAVLFEMASAIGIDLIGTVNSVLDASRKRDQGRFLRHWDPVTASALGKFHPIIDTTACIFAKRAKLWGAPDYDKKLSIRENAIEFSAVLARFCKVAFSEGLDGFVICLSEQQHFIDTSALSKVLNLILNGIAESHEQGNGINVMRDNFLSPTWRFSFNGVTFFITTFAPFYEVLHPRHSPLSDAAFIFFQPEFSFDHHGIHGKNPDRDAIKKTIRENFDRKLSGYSAELVEQPIEAFKYIKPLMKDGEPIVWWE